ncbi:leucine-rich repeat-containing protein 52 [Brachyhypopomus gauderio]|uniref:leucine-rich repeat-containing protein 52 n=1 Tax=Brachyhypopomus gauderio TaxID=698409 RepID=UPI0040426E99
MPRSDLLPVALVLNLFVILVTASPVVPGCPQQCVCDDQFVVQCAGLQLTNFPLGLPLTTRQLILSNNRLVELPALEMNYLSELVYLDCSNNSLTEISEATFGNLQKLVYLDLSYNRISRIDEQLFGPLASLVMLRLTDNPTLSDIHPRAFTDNVALQVLDVSSNRLATLNTNALSALPGLRYLGLSGNPWMCECHMEELCLWFQTEALKFQDVGQTVCDGPPALRGRRLSEVGQWLSAQCHPGLGHGDYLFFLVIGIATFTGGTVLVWTVGVMVVVWQRYRRARENRWTSVEKGWMKEEKMKKTVSVSLTGK